MNKKIIYIGAGILVLLLLVLVFFFFRSTPSSSNQPSTGFFGIGGNVSTTGTNGGSTNTPQTGALSLQKVFKISDGPIASAVFMQTSNPTTTVARYVMQDNGHVFDVAVDVPGAAARPASNTTIPGVVSATWGRQGSSTILQYVDGGAVKSIYMEFAPANATGAAVPVRIQFLPNSIVSLATSPDGKSLSYLLKTEAGVDGYIANADGTNPRKVFSLPLSQVLLSWPAPNVLMVQTKSAVGVPGVALAVNIKTGALSPMLYTPGLSATANSVFSKVVYQTSSGAPAKATTYTHDVATGKDAPMANNPIPEKCAWSKRSPTDLYCAFPLDAMAGGYLDLWHKGLVQTADSILRFDTNNGVGTVITLPGDGGVRAPIDYLAVSPDEHYILFITRGDRSLWGVRLTQ